MKRVHATINEATHIKALEKGGVALFVRPKDVFEARLLDTTNKLVKCGLWKIHKIVEGTTEGSYPAPIELGCVGSRKAEGPALSFLKRLDIRVKTKRFGLTGTFTKPRKVQFAFILDRGHVGMREGCSEARNSSVGRVVGEAAGGLEFRRSERSNMYFFASAIVPNTNIS